MQSWQPFVVCGVTRRTFFKCESPKMDATTSTVAPLRPDQRDAPDWTASASNISASFALAGLVCGGSAEAR